MKKKLIIFFFLIILVGIGGFLYIYKEHRDIAAEKEVFTITVNDLFSVFQSNEITANAKYLDKTIEVTGKISSVDSETKSIVINEKLFVTFTEKIPKTIQSDSNIKIKGRFIGYDGLLEELKMDQSVIVSP